MSLDSWIKPSIKLITGRNTNSFPSVETKLSSKTRQPVILSSTAKLPYDPINYVVKMFAAKMLMAKVSRTLDDNRCLIVMKDWTSPPLCWHTGCNTFPFFGSETDKIGLEYRRKKI